MVRAGPRQRLAGDDRVLQLPHLQKQLRTERRTLHLLTEPGAFAREQTRHHGQRELHRAGGVRNCGAGRHRGTVSGPADRDDATARLRSAVQHRLVGIGTERTEPVHRRVNQLRMTRMQRREIETHALERRRAEVRQKYVALAEQPFNDARPSSVL